ncbi:MAG: nickel pincer cofactor biosynthesis protein LarB [Chitinispirillaceae bacterium]|nr:nickel pincer cofactor biosynthesis protein LarB [Chitinispirillaceae bacterium]
MEESIFFEILNKLYKHNITPEDALKELRSLPFSDLGFAKVDHHRVLRKGIPEVIFCEGKTPEQVVGIAKSQLSRDETIFGTRANGEIIEAVLKEITGVEVDGIARCFWKKSSRWKECEKVKGEILICAAGTADMKVTLEAKHTLEIIGHPHEVVSDVGVAGIHRLFSHREKLEKASVIIAVAGMEGALPSVIAGYVSCPVIGVPTSIGYGSHLGGLVPLFAMLNSCASGLTVVNIDNGFGAACAAAAINKM